MPCPSLPPPPPPAPPPSLPPVPPPSPPAAMPPAAPPGTPQLALDLANSYAQPLAYCLGFKSLAKWAVDGILYCDYGIFLTLAVQNISGTASGSMTLRVSVDNANVRVTADHNDGDHLGETPVTSHADATITVPAGNVVLTDFTITINTGVAGAVDPGTIVVTVDNGAGSHTYNLVTQGFHDCAPGGG